MLSVEIAMKGLAGGPAVVLPRAPPGALSSRAAVTLSVILNLRQAELLLDHLGRTEGSLAASLLAHFVAEVASLRCRMLTAI